MPEDTAVSCAKLRTDQGAVYSMDSGGPKETCKMGCTLSPPGEYDRTIRVRQRYGLFVKLV